MNPRRSSRFGRALGLAVVAWIGLARPAAPQAPAPPPTPEAEEAFLALRYGPLDVVIAARVVGDSVYLPLGELFHHLRVEYRYDPAARRAHGFFATPTAEYELDLARRTARCGPDGPRLRLQGQQFLLERDDVYVLPSLLQALFGLRADVDLRKLTVRITAPHALPIDRAPSGARPAVALPEPLQPPAPLRFPRARRPLNGGVLQYALAATAAPEGASLAYDVGGGAELLGGDLQVTARGRLGDDGAGWRDTEARWRYVVGPENGLLRQVRVGTLRTPGTRPFEYLGIAVSNEPVEVRTRIGAHIVAGRTRPGWEVELYLNGELAGYTRADARGEYRFALPLVYGTSLLSIKTYGPHGEIETDERRIDVPHTFVPAGRLEYTASAGRLETDPWTILQARAHYGLTDGLTLGFGVERIGAPGRGPSRYGAAALRLPANWTAGYEAMPGIYRRVSVQGAFPSLADVALSYTFARPDPLYNPLGNRHETRARAFLPLRLLGIPLGLNLSGTTDELWSGTRTYAADGDLLFNFAQVKPSLGYGTTRLLRGETAYELGDRVRVGLFVAAATPGSTLQGTVLDATAEYDPAARTWRQLRIQLSRSLSARGRLALGIEDDPLSEGPRAELRYQVELPALFAITSLRRHPTGTAVTPAVRGGIGFDPRHGDLFLSARDQLGRAGATIRLFLDANGDGAYQPGEPLIEPTAARFRQAVSTRITADSLLRAEDLIPYQRYSVRLDPRSLPNPLWIPAYDSFSFLSDPNSFKPIDVPFYAGAAIEGRAYYLAPDGSEQGVPGLTVRVRQTDGPWSEELTTFRNGAFYSLGVPPGEYEATLDPRQLAQRGLAARAATLRFTVRPTLDGDEITGLDFRLEREPARP